MTSEQSRTLTVGTRVVWVHPSTGKRSPGAVVRVTRHTLSVQYDSGVKAQFCHDDGHPWRLGGLEFGVG
jgi:hypothetical protein